MNDPRAGSTSRDERRTEPGRPSPPRYPAEKPLTVAYILKMFPRFSETFIANEILEVERRGARVVVFSMKPPNESIRQELIEKIAARRHVVPPLRGRHLAAHGICHLRCLSRAPHRYARTLFFVARRGTRAAWQKFLVAPWILREAQAAGVEHMHAHFASGPARQAKLVSLLSGIPFSFTAHAKDLFWAGHQHGKNNKLKKRVRTAAFVITISEFNRRFVHRLGFRVPRRRVLTLYNGLDLDHWSFIRPAGRPVAGEAGSPPLILAVGRLVPKKGFHDLVGACRLLHLSGVPFRCVIAGDGPEADALRAHISEAGLDGKVELGGLVPLNRLADSFYPQAAVLAQPSIIAQDGDQDGIPTVILEALAIGLPVIATPVSGIGEAVYDGRTGLLVPPGDPPALAAAIQDLFRDPALAARVAAGGRALAERRFNIKNNSKALVHLFESSARGTVRWSVNKIRECGGLAPLASDADDTESPSPHQTVERERDTADVDRCMPAGSIGKHSGASAKREEAATEWSGA